jgi:glycosyltransferase involved in cell wall biosynthesis
MVKAADALVDEGYDVRLVSVNYIDWARETDRALVGSRGWRWMPVEIARRERPTASRAVSLRRRAAMRAAQVIGPARVPWPLVARAYSRMHPELVAAILTEPFDLVYGGTSGALAATAVAARRARRPFGLDLEDYHPAESEEPDAPLTHALARRVLGDVVKDARFMTTASRPMADAYRDRCGIDPLVVHNVVPKPATPPGLRPHPGPLRLYWFSQTVGPKRGLEEVVQGVAAARVPAVLDLRGLEASGYVTDLRRLAAALGAPLELRVRPPGPPDQMVELSAPYDVGLSPEQMGVENRALCLPNKPLTYLAAGLAIVATDTPGQRSLGRDVEGAVHWYPPGDVPALAAGLRRWSEDRDALGAARQASWRAASVRWHWEHPLERGALLDAIRGALR